MKANSAARKVKDPLTVSEELLLLKDRNDGLLDPAKVVDYARNPDTALHSRFEWNDSKAAEDYRLWQARQIIRLELVVIRQDSSMGPARVVVNLNEREEQDVTVRAFVSLGQDRFSEESEPKGYRSIHDVLADEELRELLLQEARRDMKVFQKKYKTLNELAKVFSAMEEVL